jgi:hypothetical protein
MTSSTQIINAMQIALNELGISYTNEQINHVLIECEFDPNLAYRILVEISK